MKQRGPARRRRGACSANLLIAVLFGFASSAVGQDFSETRLKEGEDAYRQRRFPEAVDQLRIAAFGLMDRPALLSEALVHLSLAQEAAGRREDAQATVARFAEVERRFAPYGTAKLESAVRSDFESRFRQRLPPSVPATVTATAAPAQVRESVRNRSAPEPPFSTDGGESSAEGIDAAPRVKKSVRPVYPRAALQARVGGTVVLKVLVSERGEPLEVEIIVGIRPDLSEAAVEALKRWTFEPARSRGRDIRAWTSVTIAFAP